MCQYCTKYFAGQKIAKERITEMPKYSAMESSEGLDWHILSGSDMITCVNIEPNILLGKR